MLGACLAPAGSFAKRVRDQGDETELIAEFADVFAIEVQCAFSIGQPVYISPSGDGPARITQRRVPVTNRDGGGCF